MDIPYTVAQDSSGALVYVTCTAEQAVKLTKLLRAEYPSARPQVIPAPTHAHFSHCFRVPEDEPAFRGRWQRLQIKLLFATAAPPLLRPRPAPKPPHAPRLRPASAPPAAPLVEPVFTVAYAVPEPNLEPPDPRLPELDRLLESGLHHAVIDQLDAAERSAAVRARLGMALARAGRGREARGHLAAAWKAGACELDASLELAHLHWQAGDFDHAARTYLDVLDTLPEQLDRRHCEALAELAAGGEFPEIGLERQFALIEAFLSAASEDESRSDALATRCRELARQIGDAGRVFHSYQHLLDVQIARRSGQGVLALLEDAYRDYWSRLLTARDRFDLLDEISEYLPDYPVLRRSLVSGYEELLRDALDQAGAPDGVLPEYTRDLSRALRGLERKNETLDRYLRERKVAQRSDLEALAESDGDESAAVGLSGRRIALVGGHDRTREHVREWLEQRGARVDEVAPPNNGRIGERDVQDKVQYSELLLLIVGYMGHDMSKVVTNLQRRSALQGEVLPVDCRGTSGICRAILGWAARQT